jgi:hypothetical protein
MKLRDGEITLSQLINRLQSQKTGKHRLCLDDLKPILDPEVFTKPEKDMLAAFRETMVANCGSRRRNEALTSKFWPTRRSKSIFSGDAHAASIAFLQRKKRLSSTAKRLSLTRK